MLFCPVLEESLPPCFLEYHLHPLPSDKPVQQHYQHAHLPPCWLIDFLFAPLTLHTVCYFTFSSCILTGFFVSPSPASWSPYLHPPPSCSDFSSFYKLSFWSCRVNRFSHVLLLSDWCQYWDQLWLTLTQLQILHLIINLWWVIRVHWEVLLCVLLQWVQVKSQYNRYDINIEWIHLYKRLLLTALLYDSDQPLVKMSEAMTCDTFWSALHCLLNPFHIYNW